MKGSLAVLRPSLHDWERARALLDDATTAVYDDLGEQAVWRRLYAQVNELPAGYCALKAPACVIRETHAMCERTPHRNRNGSDGSGLRRVRWRRRHARARRH